MKKNDINILILEAIPKHAKFIKFAIDELGYSSTILTSLTNIVDEIRSRNPDIVIISPQVNVDANELCLQISSSLTCPILLGIYDSTNDDPQKSLNAGAADYFRLPANWDLFKTKLIRCLNEQQNKAHTQELIALNFIECIKSFSTTCTNDFFCVLITQVSNSNANQLYLHHTETINELLSYENNIDEFRVQGNKLLLISTTATNKREINALVQQIKNRLDFFVDMEISSTAFLYSKQTQEPISTLVLESFDLLSDKSKAAQDVQYIRDIPSKDRKALTA